MSEKSIIEILGKKWITKIILIIKKYKSIKFTQLKLRLGITGKSLSIALKTLLEKNILEKTIIPNTPILVTYSLTNSGKLVADSLETLLSNSS